LGRVGGHIMLNRQWAKMESCLWKLGSESWGHLLAPGSQTVEQYTRNIPRSGSRGPEAGSPISPR